MTATEVGYYVSFAVAFWAGVLCGAFALGFFQGAAR